MLDVQGRGLMDFTARTLNPGFHFKDLKSLAYASFSQRDVLLRGPKSRLKAKLKENT